MQRVLFGLLLWSALPAAAWAIEPNVTTDVRSKSQRTDADISCVQIPDSYQTVGPLTVKEIEAEVDVGKAHAEWKQFLRQLQKGDQLFMYDEGCCKGIIIVRKECIVDWFPTSET